MNFLIKFLTIAVTTQRIVTAIGATIVITVGVRNYLKNQREQQVRRPWE